MPDPSERPLFREPDRTLRERSRFSKPARWTYRAKGAPFVYTLAVVGMGVWMFATFTDDPTPYDRIAPVSSRVFHSYFALMANLPDTAALAVVLLVAMTLYLVRPTLGTAFVSFVAVVIWCFLGAILVHISGV